MREYLDLNEEDQNRVRLILIDDGSDDGGGGNLKNHIPAKTIFTTNSTRLGQGASIWRGLAQSDSEFIGILDGDGQNPISDILTFHQYALSSSNLAVLGFRSPRNDTWRRKLYSQLANGLARIALNSKIKDMGCSTKVFHHSLKSHLMNSNNFHRYLGHQIEAVTPRFAQLPASHRARTAGRSKSNASRAFGFLRDLLQIRHQLKKVEQTL